MTPPLSAGMTPLSYTKYSSSPSLFLTARALRAVILGASTRAYFSSGTGLIWPVLTHHLSSLRMAPTLSSATLESADLMARTCGSAELSLGVYGRVFVRLRRPAFLLASVLDLSARGSPPPSSIMWTLPNSSHTLLRAAR